MKTVAVFFNQPGKLDYPFHDSMYFESYRDFTRYCAERGIDLVIVRGAKSYLGGMLFEHGWRFVGDELLDINAPITADLIYNKELDHDLITDPGDLVINTMIFDKIGRDKWLTALAFPDLVPRTYQIDAENWHDVLAKITTDKVVLKPVAGTEGNGIVVEEKSKIDFPSLALTGPYIAQEFVDSSGGIPGICTGMHDLRILLFNGEPKLSFVRQPKSGSMLSNVAQGGSSFSVDIERVPAAVIEAARTVDAHYRQYTPRFYTADFFMQGERPYLIETNTRPGFPHHSSEGEAFTAQFYQYLYELLKGAIESHSKR